jgi:PAS domain-containing protein
VAEHHKSLPVPIDGLQKRGHVPQTEIFRLLVESVRDYAIFVLDPEGHLLTWNPGAQAMKGYSKDEIIGKHFSKFYLPEAVESGGPNANWSLPRKKAASPTKAGGSKRTARPSGHRSSSPHCGQRMANCRVLPRSPKI